MNPYESKHHERMSKQITFFKNANEFMGWMIIAVLSVYGFCAILTDTKIIINKNGGAEFFFEEKLKKWIRNNVTKSRSRVDI